MAAYVLKEVPERWYNEDGRWEQDERTGDEIAFEVMRQAGLSFAEVDNEPI